MSRRSRDLADLTVLRYVPGRSVIHRVGALAKILVLVSVTLALTFRATWTAVGVAALFAVGGFVAARLPFGVLPRPPKLLWLMLGASAGLAVVAGGDPVIDVAGTDVGLGGLEAFTRFVCLAATVLLLAGLVGWTTPAADLTPAIAAMLRPLRPLRLPVDEMVASLALAVRVLPLLIDELRTVSIVLRLRDPDDPRPANVVLLDVMTTVATVSVRRAGELGDALVTRGGIHTPTSPPRFGPLDAVAVVTGVGAAVAVILA